MITCASKKQKTKFSKVTAFSGIFWLLKRVRINALDAVMQPENYAQGLYLSAPKRPQSDSCEFLYELARFKNSRKHMKMIEHVVAASFD